MELNSWLGDMSGLSTVYHFTPDEPEISARHVVLNPPKLLAAIQPGDTVNVRCGGIAHTAVVLLVDRSRDAITFTDPLYEYWQPDKNTCITSFSLKPYKYGYQAATLKLSEVGLILDSVQATRSFVPPQVVGEAAEGDAPVPRNGAACRLGPAVSAGFLGMQRDEALKQDLFQFFNFERVATHARGNTTIEIYLVRALEFRGDVMLRLQTRDDCVVAASLFLRRSFLGGSRRAFAGDLLGSFLRGVYGGEGKKALEAAIAGPGTARADGNEQLAAVMSGRANAVSFQAAGHIADFGNVATEAGSLWFRVSAR